MTRPTSPKLEALRASLSKAIDAQHEREIDDDIRREEEHLRTCPFAKAERAASRSAATLTGLAIDRGDALDRLLAILKAPLRYDNGEPLTREERIEWAIRCAPKT